MTEKIKIDVLLNSSPPECLLIVEFLWGKNHNFDSDGDFDKQNKRPIDLYASSRERKNESFSVVQSSDNPLIYQVSSEIEEIASKVAEFLARETNGKVLN